MSEQPISGTEWVQVDSLLPWARNPKPHNTENVAAIAREIVRHGFADPIVAWRSRRWIAAGHGRFAAVSLLYREDPGRLIAPDQVGKGTVLVRWIEFASEGEFQAYAIANNRLTEANPMDLAQVSDLVREMAESGTPVEGIGYTADELQAMMAANEVPSGEDWGAAMDGLPDQDRQPIQQMTFTLHDDQAETIKRAIERAKSMGDFVDTGNENSNGNALARVAEMFLGGEDGR